MRILDIREAAIPLKSELKNSSFDFTEMTTSVVAVITDVMREGRAVTGFAFNSTGRYACGAQMRARFIPRILAAKPDTLLDNTGENLDPAKILGVMMQREKSGGHSESPRLPASRCTACSPSAITAAASATRFFATSAAAGICRARPRRICRTRCAAISTPATRW